jgi:hypothetical protein
MTLASRARRRGARRGSEFGSSAELSEIMMFVKVVPWPSLPSAPGQIRPVRKISLYPIFPCRAPGSGLKAAPEGHLVYVFAAIPGRLPLAAVEKAHPGSGFNREMAILALHALGCRLSGHGGQERGQGDNKSGGECEVRFHDLALWLGVQIWRRRPLQVTRFGAKRCSFKLGRCNGIFK